MERLFELIEYPARTAMADRPMLCELTDRYPWFVAPRLLLLRLAEGNEAERIRNALILRLMYHPAPSLLLDTPDWNGWQRKAQSELIDDFLTLEDKRIVVDESRPDIDCDLSRIEDGEDEFASETLARIYAAQGLADQAGAIYRRLSLKFPEKSVYFADRISELTEKK